MTTIPQNKNWGEKLWRETSSRDGLSEIRAQAWRNFEKSGFPNSKDEFWRYTATTSVSARDFSIPSLPKPDARLFDFLQKRLEPFKSSARLIFLDGWFMPQISDLKPIAKDADFTSMRELALNRPGALSLDPEKTSQFEAMNMALFQDGLWLNIHEGASPAAALLVYFLQTSSSSERTAQIRHSISLGKNSALKIIEWHDALDHSEVFFNQQMEINLASQSQLEHLRIQGSGAKTWMRCSSKVVLAEKSRYQRLDFEAGSKVSRNEIQTIFSGGESICELKGIGLGSGAQHLDTQVVVDHSVPSASSDQVYRNLLSGKSRGVFGGCVRVHRDAQKTDAHQVHKTLLLSSEAQADTKPQLEIDADDVQCSHGAAIGQLDEDSLFYLRSRGIGLANAEKMLASGFVEKILDSISDESLRNFSHELLKERLMALFA